MNEIRAYLYTLRDDNTVNVYEGSFSPPPYQRGRQGRFYPDKGAWCYVSREPGEVYYRKIWLKERDDELAKRLYIEYHERKIKELERNLEMHKQAIELLKEIEDHDISL